MEIFLGDYVDRGPQSRDVIEWMISAPPVCDERICLLGNHEDMLLRALDESDWMDELAAERRRSRRCAPTAYALPRFGGERRSPSCSAALLRRPAGRAIAPSWKRCRASSASAATLFVHAGVRPGVPLDAQDPDDLVWIREPFLSSDADFGKVVVHGHTPAEAPEVRPNRINVDTGAFFTGRLTCLVLEGDGAAVPADAIRTARCSAVLTSGCRRLRPGRRRSIRNVCRSRARALERGRSFAKERAPGRAPLTADQEL